MTAATASTAAPARPSRRRRVPWSLKAAPYLFLLPNMVIFGLFTIWPAISGFNISLYSSRNGRTFEWAGTGNFERIFSDAEFYQALFNTIVFVLAFVGLGVCIAVVLAVLLNAQGFGKSFFRSVFFLPVLLSPVVVGIVWRWLLERNGGLVNEALGAIGIPAVPWLVDPQLAMVSVIAVSLWTNVGFYTMILLAGLQSIDPNLYEAASLDGASHLQQFRSITLPMLAPTTMVVLILSTIHGFQAFDVIYNLTGGGPVGATTLLVQYVYDNAFGPSMQYGMAAAGSVVLFVIVMCFTLLNWLLGRRAEAV
ncbi:sugar ABC transporter permease [Brachybacterium muris]|uniref:Sugar ABC transporter permease n=1 Tax=Brachybacterium muris UCD-AY4 TaxID=1249481 RepID=A0A022KWH8_9MICO|nr:sugar ABC transporter permease [Brachybacterium muris]EYT50149.1 sugar ABC transporter permease [Brachybacterium muris UCD-AY4]MBM7500007.1 ABC-type sugar transport system permease subunit [Brachybacterium muris]MCT1431380.1 sugar ABC transporter permease [Brachybacterium muris]MCT1654520.1 sugar ABC transporter permease [Brachybacterium muris]MCT1998215.1 sugar ABC transporter permease [Brachybacterium muris]